MGLGYDDLLVPALVHAGFETKDLVLVVRTDANLAWVRQHAPRATTVRLPYASARKANVVSGLAPHAALKRACAGVGLDPLDLLVSERALRRNRVDTAMNFLNLAAEELEAAIEDGGPGHPPRRPRDLATRHTPPVRPLRPHRCAEGDHPVGAAGRGPLGRLRRPDVHRGLARRARPPDGFRAQPRGRDRPGDLAPRERPHQGVRGRPRRQPAAAEAERLRPAAVAQPRQGAAQPA